MGTGVGKPSAKALLGVKIGKKWRCEDKLPRSSEAEATA